MLRELAIRNLAVIEDVTVPFSPGLNVLTGETGAGKSILVDAILLVVGARAQPDLIRSGEDAAIVQAVFDIDDSGAVALALEHAGHGRAGGQLIVKREISRSGRHRVFVNDEPATVGLLDLLDRFAECGPRRERVAALVRAWEDARGRRERLDAELREAARQEDLYRFQLSEIDAVKPTDGEEDELRAERNRLQHAERIAAGLGEAMALLQEDERSAVSAAGRAASVLRSLVRFDPGVVAAVEALDGAQAHLEDAVGRVRALREHAVFDPDRLEEIDGRLDALGRLKRKYGADAAAIRAYRAEIALALERVDQRDALAAELERAMDAAAAAAGAEAGALSEERERAAERLERLLQKEARGLGMGECRIKV